MATARPAMSREAFFSAPPKDEASAEAVSWAAVFAGAFATAALSLILMVLGAGVGLSSVSPWPNAGADASRVSAGAIVWLIIVQIAAAALGGYLAGRLRTKWVSLHTHEVYFRDTAHGFMAWAVALVISTVLFATIGAAIINDRAATPPDNLAGGYFVDMLFRTDHPTATRIDQALRNEAALILANTLRHPQMANQDERYLANLISAATGLSQMDAQQRVVDTVAADREAEDAARKAIAHSLYWLFAAFLIGAFCASYAATIGGRQRDRVPALP
jgi:hypothetical protein